MKKQYFQAFKRAFSLQRSVANFRRKNLLRKVITSFKKKKEFEELKIQMREICLYKYEDNLLAKSFDKLFEFSQKKRKLRSLLKVFVLQNQRSVMFKVFTGLYINRQKKLSKRKEYEKAYSKYEKVVMQKVIDKLAQSAKKNKWLKNAQTIV